MCTQYMHDQYVFQSYCLYDKFKKGAKVRTYRLIRKQDFNAFYLLIRVFRENKIHADKYMAKQKIAQEVHLIETGLVPDPKDKGMTKNVS